MKFSQITEVLKYPSKHKAKIATAHSDIIVYALEHIRFTKKDKQRILDVINYVSYAIIQKEAYVIDYNSDNPFASIPDIDVDLIKSKIKGLYLEYDDVEFDKSPNTATETKEEQSGTSTTRTSVVDADNTHSSIKILLTHKAETILDTPKEYLYLRAPQYPRMDTSKLFMNDCVGNEHFYMHPSLPIIPEKQTDISCTTDVKLMTDRDLMKLFPNRLIRTRAEVMYQPYGDIPMDEDLGLLIPINGYSKEDIRDNIIKYPHFYQLTRLYNDEEISFYKHIEIDGKLFPTLDVWDSLPDSKRIPKTAEFIKEYVIRKYLLDRDHGVKHNYPLRGTLEPYLTLFAPPDFYGEDPIELARACVTSRVSYLRSRNPYIERYSYVKQGILPPNTNNNCPFKQYCRQNTCSTICANLVEFEYLMERNGLLGNKSVLSLPNKYLRKASECLVASEGTYKVSYIG